MNREEVIKKAKALGFDSSEYIIVSSSILAVLNLRPARDIDITVSQRLFDRLLKDNSWHRESHGETFVLSKDVFEIATTYGNIENEFKFEDLKKDQFVVDGVPFCSIETVRKWKSIKNRPKDHEDIKLLDTYLASAGSMVS